VCGASGRVLEQGEWGVALVIIEVTVMPYFCATIRMGVNIIEMRPLARGA